MFRFFFFNENTCHVCTLIPTSVRFFPDRILRPPTGPGSLGRGKRIRPYDDDRPDIVKSHVRNVRRLSAWRGRPTSGVPKIRARSR